MTGLIGAGGMGVVYRAHDERLDRSVALKVLPAGMLADDSARRRFRKEALALSQLNHPNIATVHDFDTVDGTDFLVMEEITGATLQQSIESGPLPEADVARHGAQLAEGLAAAHEKGFVHRDLKPANLRLTPDARLKILDFGLAKWLHVSPVSATRSLTEGPETAGTLPYMAPEQLQGKDVDARADIYAAGATLYEMATGQRPFPEPQPAPLISAILTREPVPPRASNPRISPELERIILKCLEKLPENRYQSARELEVDLRRLGAGSGPRAPAASPPRQARALPVVAGTAVALAVVAAALSGRPWTRWGRRAGSHAITSLAVLPLENLSGDAQQDYFADGMTEELTAELAQVSAMRVISRTSVMQYKRTHKTVPEIGRELNVDALIEGSVLRDGDRVRITAQLIETADDKHLWADTYDRDLHDVLSLQSEVARKIAQEVNVTLTPQERNRLAATKAVDPEAHDDHLRALSHLDRGTEQDLHAARDLFQRAITRDPGYAAAYAGLADVYVNLSTYYEPPRVAMPKAKEAALKSLALDETLSAAHNSLASVYLFYDWDFAAAEREARRAIELRPNDAMAHDTYGAYLAATGHGDQGTAELERAQALDPYSESIAADLVFWPTFSRQYDLAIRNGRKLVSEHPDLAVGHAYLQIPLSLTGSFEEAIAEGEAGHRLDSSPLLSSFLATTSAMAGDRAHARKLLGEIDEALKKRYSCSYEVAVAEVALGEMEKAFSRFEQAYDDRSDCMALLKVDPRLDRIRSDPRYQELVRRVGFP